MKSWWITISQRWLAFAIGVIVIGALLAFEPWGVNWREAWLKWLDKRLDVVSNLITGILLAAVALLSWLGKLYGGRPIKLRHDREDTIRAREQKLKLWTNHQILLAHDSLKYSDPEGRFDPSKVDVFNEYKEWLEESRLRKYAPNRANWDAISAWDVLQRPTLLESLTSRVLETRMPEPSDDAFPW